MVPFPEPDGVGVHQVWSLPTVHAVLEVTENVVEPDRDVTFRLDGVTESVGAPAACVTVTTTGVRPETVTVTLAVRLFIVVFMA